MAAVDLFTDLPFVNLTMNNFNGRFHSFSHQSFNQILSQFDTEAAFLINSFKATADSLSIASLPFRLFSTFPVGGVALRNLCKPQQASGGHLILHFNNVWTAKRTLSALSIFLPSCNFHLEERALHLSLPLLSASRRTILQTQLSLTFRNTNRTLRHTRTTFVRRMRLVPVSSFDFRLSALSNLEDLSSAASSLISAVYTSAASRLLS
ncbi:MAG: hypothetical protein ACTS46_00445 [Candidatus Hodgkinia cicadicola]